MTTGNAVRLAHPGVSALGQRAVVYYPPVDTDLFRPRPDVREEARASLGVHTGDAVVVGALGNVNAQKGHEYALRAVAACADAGQNVCLRILGARSEAQHGYEEHLLAEAADLGLLDDGRFAIVEPGAGLPQLLSGVDIGLLAAVPLSEGVPTMVLEAMAAGVPVVATDVGGVTEAVHNQVDGIVVQPLDSSAIADALSRLAMDAQLRSALALHARRTAVERFDLAHCAQVHLSAYRHAAERRATRASRSDR
jgi:glycosyltransferase involved in cell wall biosynthesis